MPLLLIPLLIFVGVVAWGAGGDILQNFDFSLPSLRSESQEETQESPRATTQQPSPTQGTTQPRTPQSPKEPPKEEPPPESPSFEDKVRIESVDRGGSRIVLASSLQEGETVDITGWRVESKWRGTFQIPPAHEIYHYDKTPGPVVLQAGDRVEIRGVASPFGVGVHFKPNKCFGYLKSTAQNLPGPSQCPHDKPSQEEVSHFLPSCQEYLLNGIDYTSCVTLDLSKRQDLDGQCQNHLRQLSEEFSYNACYLKHFQDEDFAENTWHFYTGRQFPDPLHDEVTLRTAEGRLLDSKQY